MVTKLIALLKKDAILATRSKVWTLFELLFPVLLLFIVTAFIGEFSKTMNKAMEGMEEMDFEFTENSRVFYMPPSEMCGVEKTVPYHIVLRDSSDKVTKEYLGEWSENTDLVGNTITRDDIFKKFGDCEEAIVSATVSGHEVKLLVPDSMTKIPTEDWKTPMSAASDPYMFSSLFIQAVLASIKEEDKGTGWSKRISVKRIDSRKLEIAEIALSMFHAIIGISMAVSIINIVRTVVTEKATVKPYLSAIGLPGWMFYTEHFIASLLKSFITCFGAMYFFMGIEHVSLGVQMFAVVLYIIGGITFAIMISSIFTNAKRGIEAALVFWIFFVCYPLAVDESDMALFYALNINHAYNLFLKKSQTNSMANHKMSVAELWDMTYIEGTAPGYFLMMMVVDGILMFAVAMLIDRYGGKLSAVKDLFKGDNKRMKAGGSHNKDVILEGCVENEKARKKAVSDVELKNVVKIYPTGEKAVNGLSFRAIRGQVSILLGQNGCGKSTTFSMISGVALPTSGSIQVAGVDAVRNKEKARKFIGFCPQYNPLYDKLTVLEHLELVNALKDGPPRTFMAEAKQLLQAIRLADKTGTQSSQLSGGMKRKLCVCMAMIGGSKVVLLDEPTAGMDPGARKDVQLMLEKIKVNRTILLTTHYMDEAERLGDWVFVMSYGKMAASGSLNYLKKKFGSGYCLTVVLDAKSDRKHSLEMVEAVCTHTIRHAKLKDQRGQMIEMTLPEEEKSKVLPLLKALEAIIHKKYKSSHLRSLPHSIRERIKKLRITTLGLSLSSLETVFIRICDECDIAISGKELLNKRRETAENSYDKLTQMKTERRVTGSQLQSNQFSALIRKKYYYTLRNISQLFFQFLIPVAIVLFGLIMVKSDEDTKVETKETLDMNLFPESVVVVRGSGSKLQDVKSQLEGFKQLTVKTEDTSPEDLVSKYYKEKFGFVVDVNDDDLTIRYNLMGSRSSAILVIVALNWYLKDGPYTGKIEWVVSKVEDAQNEFGTYLSIPMFTMFAFALVTAPFVQFGIEERVCKFSHQQHLTGMSRLIYWASMVAWDSILFVAFSGIVLLLFLAYNQFTDSMPLIILIFFILLLAILPIAYTASLIFESPTKASSLLILYQVVVGFMAVMITMLLTMLKSDLSDVITPILYFICPPTAFLWGFFKATAHKMLEADPDGPLSSMVEFKELWEWKGLVRDIFFLVLAHVVFTATMYAMQNRSTRVAIFDLRHKATKPIPKKPVKLAPCKAVFQEERLVHSPQIKRCTVVVKDLVRVFGKFRAVNGLCVTVKNNECFGLLGTNGAGKTTTFDILTGLRFPSGGSAHIDGRDVVRHNYVGYCPQFDSILPDLKCIEALQIMAQLHGYADPEKAVKHVLTCVGMVEHCEKNVRMCSGGQKRKISVGIAMLTRAKCIMMDEPTAGIDPRARREIWEILDWMREKSGSSIVLTSHSMEECEALCSRIAILRKGEMIALGTSQDLKSQYGNTYTMTMIVKKISDRERVCRQVHKRIRMAVLKTAMTNITTSLVWELPRKKNDRWSKKYEKVEKLAKKLGVKDFMLTQSSLEDTFINLTD